MGKQKYTVSNSDNRGREVNISRAAFAAAIERAEREAGSGLYDLVPKADIDRIKREATVMDAHSWRCQGSCGCPMTNLGVVTTIRGTDETGPPDVASTFAGAYDTEIGRVLGHLSGGPYILNIQD